MVTTRFIGRLGNSMFQAAACMSYAKKYGFEWAVPGDARESSIHRVYPDLPKTGNHYQGFPKNGYDAAHYEFYEWPEWGDNILLQGFFQSERFFQNCIPQVKKMFALEKIDGFEKYCSIHVRRGDFVQHNKSFPPLTVEWIRSAMDKMGANRYLLFSDDIHWCSTNLGTENIDYSSAVSELDDLQKMASCSDHIVANSTFSWWAAYLGQNPERKIICPNSRDWYGPENSVVTYARSLGKEPCMNLIPEGWIQL